MNSVHLHSRKGKERESTLTTPFYGSISPFIRTESSQPKHYSKDFISKTVVLGIEFPNQKFLRTHSEYSITFMQPPFHETHEKFPQSHTPLIPQNSPNLSTEKQIISLSELILKPVFRGVIRDQHFKKVIILS
jgi:hypothetical protein